MAHVKLTFSCVETMHEDIECQGKKFGAVMLNTPVSVSVENDGIGAYEFWGYKGFDKGSDYSLVETEEDVSVEVELTDDTVNSAHCAQDILEAVAEGVELILEDIKCSVVFEDIEYNGNKITAYAYWEDSDTIVEQFKFKKEVA